MKEPFARVIESDETDEDRVAVNRAVYHTANGVFHKGPKADCAKCKSLPKSSKKAAGRKGGKKRRRNKKRRARKCKGCKKEISRQNVTGLCRKCLNAKRKRDKEEKERRLREQPKLCECGHKLASTNTSGRCKACGMDTDEAKTNRQEFQNWVTTSVFKKSARKKRGTADAPETDQG